MDVPLGYQGQQFQVWSFNYPEDGWQVFGWAGSEDGAKHMARTVLLAPSCSGAVIEDLHVKSDEKP